MSVNKFIGGQLKMVAGLTPGGGGTGSIIKVQLSSTKGNTISNVGITLNIKNKEYSSTTDSNGVAIFNGVTEVGTMTVVATAEEFISQTFKIEFFGSYELLMTDSDPYKDWLEAADLNSASYEDIDELLEDEAAVRALMTKTAAVDILANYISGERLEKIINHRYAAKWINYREYAYNKLSANEYIKRLMDTSGMYGMYITAESKSKALVPKMTSNTAPYGVASASSEWNSTYAAWNAFTSETGRWASTYGNASAHIQYKFVNPTCVKQFYVKFAGGASDYLQPTTVYLQGSNNGTDWTNIDNKNFGSITDGNYSVNNENSYLYYRLYLYTTNNTDTKCFSIVELQFYGRQLEALIPTMTSDTSPSGEVSSNSIYSGRQAWWAFNGGLPDSNTGANYWVSEANAPSRVYLMYTFPNIVSISKVEWLYANAGSASNYNVEISTDGNSWDIIFTGFANSNLFNNREIIDLKSTKIKYIRWITTSVGGLAISSAQVYSEPTLWQPKGLVPVMTSNTAPYGEAFASSEPTKYEAYRAFDGEDSYGWLNQGTTPVSNIWLKYKFINPTNVKRFTIKWWSTNKTIEYIIQGSNDNSQWYDLTERITDIGDKEYQIINNDNFYIYYRVYIYNQTVTVSTANGGQISTLQFYGRQLEALIPPMTSDTTPIGRTISSGYNPDHNSYCAFDGNDDTYWYDTNHMVNPYVGYQFNSPVCVKKALLTVNAFASAATNYVLTLQGLNNDSDNWIDLETLNFTHNTGAATILTFMMDLNNNDKYLYYRLVSENDYIPTSSIVVRNIQLYGTPDYESRTYLYDHGVNLSCESMNTYNGWDEGHTYTEPIYNNNNVTISGSTGTVSGIASNTALDLTYYNLIGTKIDGVIASGSAYASICLYPNKQVSTNDAYCNVKEPHNPETYLDISNINMSEYVSISLSNNRKAIVYALWLE